MPGLANRLWNDLSGGAPGNDLSGAGAASPSYPSILPSLAAWWDSQLGIGYGTPGVDVDTWTDQMRGIVLQAPGPTQRPAYAADGTNFRSKSVVQIASVGPKILQKLTAISPSLFLAGSRPWIGLFGRVRVYSGASQAWLTAVLDFPITQVLGGLLANPAPTVASVFGASNAQVNDNSTVVRLLSSSLSSGAGVNTIGVNGVSSGTAGSGLTLAADGKVLSLGANTAGAFPSDLSVAAIFACTAEPAAAEMTALLSKLQSDYGPF